MVSGAFRDIAILCAASAAATGVICHFAARVGRAIGVMDKPDGARKLHQSETPLIGGLALLVPALAASSIYYLAFSTSAIMLVAIAAAIAAFAIGLVDDRIALSPVLRAVLLTTVAGAVLAIDPLFILHTFLFKIFGVTFSFTIPNIVAGPFVVLMVLGFVNAANMADGMNGQLVGSVMLWSAFIIHYIGMDAGLPFIVIFCSSLVVFAFNMRGRLFSGSSGAYAASLFVGFGAIAAYRLANGAMAAQMPVYWFWLPVLDCVRLMVARTLAGRSPFAADRKHFHHLLLHHMPAPYALAVYLGLLAAPGIAAMVNDTLASTVLITCIAGYATFIVVESRRLREHPSGFEGVAEPIHAIPASSSQLHG